MLEIFREDIVREYSDLDSCRSSFELVLDQKRETLFHDLIALAKEIFLAEDELIINAIKNGDLHFSGSFIGSFRLTNDICQGLWNTFDYAQNLINIDEIKAELKVLKDAVFHRTQELAEI